MFGSISISFPLLNHRLTLLIVLLVLLNICKLIFSVMVDSIQSCAGKLYPRVDIWRSICSLLVVLTMGWCNSCENEWNVLHIPVNSIGALPEQNSCDWIWNTYHYHRLLYIMEDFALLHVDDILLLLVVFCRSWKMKKLRQSDIVCSLMLTIVALFAAVQWPRRKRNASCRLGGANMSGNPVSDKE
jgi:hypothetical protein